MTFPSIGLVPSSVYLVEDTPQGQALIEYSTSYPRNRRAREVRGRILTASMVTAYIACVIFILLLAGAPVPFSDLDWAALTVGAISLLALVISVAIGASLPKEQRHPIMMLEESPIAFETWWSTIEEIEQLQPINARSPLEFMQAAADNGVLDQAMDLIDRNEHEQQQLAQEALNRQQDEQQRQNLDQAQCILINLPQTRL